MKTELLVQMDGLAKTDDLVFLLAASNLPWLADIVVDMMVMCGYCVCVCVFLCIVAARYAIYSFRSYCSRVLESYVT